MDDRLALVAAIVSNPDEDTPRLAFADWLDENGDAHDRARAEHIRVQIEYHSLPDSKAKFKLIDRAVALQKKHAQHWLGPLGDLIRKGGFELDGDELFERGLLYWWRVSPRHFLQKSHQKGVCEWFQRVGVNDFTFTEAPTKKELPALLASPALQWVPKLRWDECNATDAMLAAIAACPHFTRLSELGFDGIKFTDRGLSKFAESAAIPNLKSFHLWSGPKAKYTAAGVLAIVASDKFPHLCDLELECDQPKSFDYAKLFADVRLKRLTRLLLGWEADLAAAVRSPNLAGLVELGGNQVAFTDADATALLANRALAGLKRFVVIGLKEPLSPAVTKKLRARFGDGLEIEMY